MKIKSFSNLDHMLNSHEPNVLFRSDTVVRNEMLVALRVRGLKTLNFKREVSYNVSMPKIFIAIIVRKTHACVLEGKTAQRKK